MKITKTQLKQIIKEELEGALEEESPEELPDTAAELQQSIGAKLVQMTEEQLAKVDNWLMRMFGDDSPDAEWRQPFGQEVKDLPQQDPAYKYSGSSRMGEAMQPRHRPEQVQGDILIQIYELIGQYRTNRSFGFHPEVTQKAVDAVLKLIQQLPQAGEVQSEN